MEPVDRKFKILAVNPCNGNIYTEDNAILFCAQDKAVPAMLRAYAKECKCFGVNDEHIESISLLHDRVQSFQANVTSKIPDTIGD